MADNDNHIQQSDDSMLNNQRLSRRTVLAGMAAAGLIGTTSQAAANDNKITNLGTAVLRTSVLGVSGQGETAYITTDTEPSYLGEVDIPSFELTNTYELPAVSSWAVTSYENGAYVGSNNPGLLMDVNTTTGEVDVVSTFLGDESTWSIEVGPDGRVYVGTYPYCRVYEYDPSTGETQWWGPMAEGEDYIRSLAIADGKVYAGTDGTDAHLVELDPSTGETRQILPDELRDRRTVYTMDAAEDKLVAHVHPGDQVLALIDRDNPKNDWRWISPDLEVDVSPYFNVYDNNVYTSALRSDSGEWVSLEYNVAADEWTELGTIPNRPFPTRYFYDGNIVGAAGESIWKKDFESGELTTENVHDLGMEPGADHPQSMTVFNNKPVAAGAGALHIHDEPSTPPGNRRSPKIVEGGAEKKRMVTVGGDLYTASYTHARIYHYDNTGELTQLAAVGHEQNRPQALAYQKATDMLLIGTRPDYGLLGGAISAYDRKSGEMIVDRNVIQDQSIYGATSIGETAYIGSEIYGGLGSDPVAKEARLAAWDPMTQIKHWEMTPVSGATQLVDLEAVDGLLFGVATSPADTTFYVVDPETQSTIHTEPLDESGLLTVGKDNNIYGTIGNGITEIDTGTFEMTHHATDLNPLEDIEGDERGNMYVIGQDQYNLYQVDVTD